MILGYGVMVTLQILVLSFLVRVRVSQLLHHCHQSSTCTLGYGVMVTLQILVLSFLVRVRVSQLESIFHSKDAFFYIPKAFLNMSPHFARYQKENPELSPWVYDEFNDFFYCISASNYLFSASIALIFSFTSFKSSFSFSTLRFISSTRLLPFLLAALRKPRLFS